MSADPSQGAFRGLRSGNTTQIPRSTITASSAPINHSRAATVIPSVSHSPAPYPLSLDHSPRPQRNSRLRYVKSSDDTETISPSASASPSPSSNEESDDLELADTPSRTTTMSTGPRPKLKLNLPKNRVSIPENDTSPAPPTALRTPSIKLVVKPSVGTEPSNSKPNPTSTAANSQKKKKKPSVNTATPGSSGKKRKQPHEDGSEDELARKPAQVRKLTLTTKQPIPSQSPITPTLKLKYRGRVPKRPLGLGYDSELDERESDPTILESFILRMPPGPDADYLRDAVDHGTIGVARSQGGADVQMKFLDRFGRRGLITIRGQRWAATLVDLPCIIEGMKSWDKKAWVKSSDICQMLLVLGKVQTDDQAKDFPLPKDVNPQTWQYAHGLTPPMRYVRQRRFARTNRTSVNAIEAVERKVNQLLADDDNAVHTKVELLDHDPGARAVDGYGSDRSDTEGGEGYDEDADADGDEVAGDYFGEHNGVSINGMMDTPTIVESQPPQEEEEDEDVEDDFIAELIKEQETAAAEASLRPGMSGLSAPEAESSMAMTSTSPSAADTAAETPGGAETSGADEDSDESEAEDDDSMDEEDREATAQKQKALDEIEELKEALKERKEALQKQPVALFRRKIIQRIEQIEGDLEAARKAAGLDGDGDDGAEDG
jgi:transcription initiation factor TFIID subunit 7